MKQRCYNPNHVQWKDWGGRGIAVCRQWKYSFEAFFEDMGPRPSKKHSLDRIDNMKGYTPENTRWATRRKQQNNTRRNRRLTFQGHNKTIAQWAQILGVRFDNIFYRLQKGWSIEQTLSEPIAPHEIRITYQGETLNILEWSKRSGIKYTTLNWRLRRGWPIERALTEPVRK
jgi:hypothetical protein